MESKAMMFSEREEIFKERTGKDFTEMWEKYYPKLLYFTNKICNDTQKAEDISIDAFMTALEKIDKYEKEKAQFSTWLFTIAKNISLQELKKSKKSISLDVDFDNEGTTLKDFMIADDEDKEFLYDIIDKKADIMRKHMSELKEPYRTVIEMREVKKMAYKDIADALGKNLSTIKSQIRNGRHILISKTKSEFAKIDELYL